MKLTVIIIDDSQINLTLFKTFVSRIDGLEPLCFAVSAEALAWCESGAPDIVIVDYMMPAPDGLEFVQRLAGMPHLQDVPVLMITANDQKQVRLAALESGATDFLAKPVDKTEFLSRVRNMATMRRNHRLLRDRAALLAGEVAAATACCATVPRCWPGKSPRPPPPSSRASARPSCACPRRPNTATPRPATISCAWPTWPGWSAPGWGCRRPTSNCCWKRRRCTILARSASPTISCSSRAG
jgi:CheY-like chemotaxis protein